MSALYMDGFDHYGSGTNGLLAMLNGSWAETQVSGGIGVPTWGTRTGLYSLQSTGGTGGDSGAYRYVLPTSESDLFVSFGFSVNGLPTANGANLLCDFRDGGNAVIASLGLTSTGGIYLADLNGATLATTQGPVIVSQNWHFIEVNFNQATGACSVRIDDATASNTPAIVYTGGTFTGEVAQMNFLAVSEFGSVPSWLDDLFIRNSSGSFNNSWLGDRRVATLFVDSDTTTQGWTPSYYKEFGTGILTLGYIIPNQTGVNNPEASLLISPNSSVDIGSADFTLETMIRWDALPAAADYSVIMSKWGATSSQLSYRFLLGGSSFNGGCLQFDTSTDGTSGTLETPIAYPWAPDLNQWYHLALVRTGGELLLFIDGIQQGLPIADTRTYHTGTTQYLTVGAEWDVSGSTHTVVSNSNIAGRLDETRFTNGYGRYTTTFTPPSAAFPRGSSDPHWADVVLLMGYDSSIIDESSFTQVVFPEEGAVQFSPNDGSDLGAYTTINKALPDDNTFISASLTAATNVFTMTSQPSNTNAVTVGTTDGTTAAVYEFKTAISSAFDVLIDTTAQGSLENLFNAINAGPGSGTKYGTGTTSNYGVNASSLPTGQFLVTANLAGTGGNSIASTATGSAASWATSTLTGGAGIPGPSEFLFQRPPNNTTIISALQMTVRAKKTDAGTATLQTTFIGPLGGTDVGSSHSLSVSPIYYNDIVEEDPDTMADLTPTTIINGKFEINRTA